MLSSSSGNFSDATINASGFETQMSNKVWHLMYVGGHGNAPVCYSVHPLSRRDALRYIDRISQSGARIWVEHYKTGMRLFENAQEKAHRLDTDSDLLQSSKLNP